MQTKKQLETENTVLKSQNHQLKLMIRQGIKKGHFKICKDCCNVYKFHFYPTNPQETGTCKFCGREDLETSTLKLTNPDQLNP